MRVLVGATRGRVARSLIVLAALAARSLIVLAALAAALSLGPRASGAATVPTGFAESTFVSIGTRLTAMAWSPDGRLFVSEKTGSLRVAKNGRLLTQPFLTVPVNSSSERGLLGVAIDPDFATNRFVYVFYINASTIKGRISRFTANASNLDVAQAGSERVLLDNIPSDAGWHNGGGLHVGPDGKLYISVGDSGSGPNGQNLGTLAGKLLRINRDGTVPADNPFVGQTNRRPEIWAYGLRNPYTFAFQRSTGRLFINDVGNATWEEINEGKRGANYGWSICEGACGRAGFTDPFYAYSHASGPGKSITGGAFYDGGRFPAEYANDYFFADYVGDYIKRYDFATGSVIPFATGIPSPVDLRVGPDGALYYLSVEGKKVGRISFGGSSTPTPTPTPTRTPAPVGDPPVATIDQPIAGTTYAAGQRITFAGRATDDEDGTLAPARLTWQVDLHHDTHTHPFVEPLSGVADGSFTIPTSGEASANTWYRIHLRAVDSDGNRTEVLRDIRPRTSTVRLATLPDGLQLALDGTPITAPYTFVGVEGFHRLLSAPARQTAGGRTYEFVGWSDGGAREHTLVTPTADATVTATYRQVAGTTELARDRFEREVVSGWGSADPGGRWLLSGTASDFAVGDGAATVTLRVRGANRGAILEDVSARDVDVRVRLRVNRGSVGGPFYAYLVVRNGNGAEYRPKVRFEPDGTIALHAGVVVGGRESPLGSSVRLGGLGYSSATWVWVRAQVVGANPTTIRIKAWANGAAEPSAWQLVVTDANAALQDPGSVGLRLYSSSRETGGPVTIRLDDYLVTAP